MTSATQPNPPSYEELQERNRFLEHQNENLTEDVNYLEELVRHLKRRRFARSSEVYSRGQGTLFDESEVGALDDENQEDESDVRADETPKKKMPKKRGRPVRKPLPSHLPRVENVIDVPEEDKVCPHSGTAITKIGEERSEQLDIEPTKAKVIVTIRPKYICRCDVCKASDDGPTPDTLGPKVKIAALEPQPIPKSMAAPGLLAYIATGKYSDALPLYRQSEIFKRAGVDLPRSTQASWMIKCGELVKPLWNLCLEEMLGLPFIQCDETRIRMLKRNGKKVPGNSYMWVLHGTRADGSQIVIYELGPSRAHTVPLNLLQGYEGYLQADGYKAYETMAEKMPNVTLIGDWVHVRRKFEEAVKAQTNPNGAVKAKFGLELINKLFEIEREMGSVSDAKKLKIRQKQSKPIVEKLKDWLDETISTVPPKTLTGKALSYALNQWHKLPYFLNDPILRLDTNPVENTIRPFVIGRKGWLFSDTENGAKASAALYSLTCMAKANGLNPFEYLKDVFSKIPNAQTADDLEKLLPWKWHRPGLTVVH
jgi:transposase